ncbi:MAG: endopeptidase La [Acidobacteria bacterium]|nr:MAG: endopeptidase La [Acidobacteriota bacterium]
MPGQDRTAHDYSAERTDESEIPQTLPVLPLKDLVAFPFMIAPLFVTRDSSVAAIEDSIDRDRTVLLVAQKSSETEDPAKEDLYEIGTVGVLMRMFKLPDQRIRILVQGLSRARVKACEKRGNFLVAHVEPIEEPEADEDDPEIEALVGEVKEKVKSAGELGRSFSPEVLVVLENLEDPGRLADLVASNLDLDVPDSQSVLNIIQPVKRLARVHQILTNQVELLNVREKITSKAKVEIDKSQREYFLRQQLKAIQTELGETDDLSEEINQYRETAQQIDLSPEARQETLRQIRRLERMPGDSAEAAIVRNYLDWMLSLPWSRSTTDNLDLQKASQILNKEHYDLEEVKTRILEYLAVLKLKQNLKGPILCFVGPPGVGKTSLGRAIATALGRKFARVSLGGVHDEAEIRGHRRTYVGAMPGKIIQALRYAETNNPVFMLDEVDKTGSDSRGDPAAALLEVLDPEQNCFFRDNFLGVPFDLSRVLFIATANLLDTIRPAFRDRMEVLTLPGYTEQEKMRIARRHLVPRQLSAHGLEPKDLSLTDASLKSIIERYTNEAGVRNLEREIASVCRKIARRVAEGEKARYRIAPKDLLDYLGVPRKSKSKLLRHDTIGVATALAWTPTGGEVFFVESIGMKGRGRLIMTGYLGDVMKESAKAAMSYARSYAAQLGIDLSLFAHTDFHIHVPEGAIPKDGPSAGIALAVSLLSTCTKKPVRQDLAMTGEITLRGRILPIGGIKEKVLAAQRSRIRSVIVPRANQPDLRDIPESVRNKIEFLFVEDMDEVVRIAFRENMPKRRTFPALTHDPADAPLAPVPMKSRR